MTLTKFQRKERLGHGGLTKIAKRTRRTLGHVSQVVSGLRRDPKVERAVARAIGLPVDDVFPPRVIGSTEAAPEPALAKSA